MNKESIIKKLEEKNLRDSMNRRDICTIYRDKELMDAIAKEIASHYDTKIDYVAAPESLGFILGTRISVELGVGFIPIRNGEVGVLAPEDSIRSSYIDHRDKVRSLQVRKTNLPKESNILLVDDWVETAATLHACNVILEEAGANLVGVAAVGCDLNPITDKMLEEETLFCFLKKN